MPSRVRLGRLATPPPAALRAAAPQFFSGLLALVACAGAGAAPLMGQEVGGQPGEAAISRVLIDSLVVEGNRRVSDEEILRYAGLSPGQVVNAPDVQDAIRRLYATGEFGDVRVRVTPYRPAVFLIEVEERPIVGRFEFRGLQHVSGGVVVDTVGLREGAALDPARVQRASATIREMLAERGFPQAEVDTALVRDPGGLPQVDLVFEVNEGPRLALAQLVFTGNETFNDARLSEAMATSEEGFLWFHGGEFHRDEYRRDLTERLPEFYGARGFIDFAVLGDTLIVDESTGKGRLEIRVSEGPRYRLAEFDVQGNRRFASSRIAAYFDPVREGALAEDPGPSDTLPFFNRTEFMESTADVADLYRNAGYLGAQVEPVVERLPAASPDDRPRVAARWVIAEGNPAYVRRVEIIGNDYTHDNIIRSRLLVIPGDIYSQELLIQSLRNIQALGFFETLPPDQAIQIEPRPDGDIDLVFRVKEKQTGNVNFGMSAAAATGIAGFIGYDQPNLFGQAKVGHFRWLFGGRTQDIEVSYSDPAVLGTQYSATVGLQSSRDRFRTFGLPTRRQTGGFFEVGTPFPGIRSTRLFVGYSLFSDEIDDIERFTDIEPAERQLIEQGTRSTISVRVVRDTRSGGLFPIAGSRNALTARFTGGPLGGQGKYGKYGLESQWYVPVGEIGGGFQSVPIQLTLGLSFNAGLILGDNPFFLERYYVGGTQIGEQLRGYEEATVTPLGHVPSGAAGFSTLDRVGEAFFTTTTQFGVKFTDNLFASAFMDAGNTWAQAAEFNPTDLLVGAGVGVSLLTPFGPIGIDYAYGFDRRDVLGRPEPGWQLHFKFGRIF